MTAQMYLSQACDLAAENELEFIDIDEFRSQQFHARSCQLSKNQDINIVHNPACHSD